MRIFAVLWGAGLLVSGCLAENTGSQFDELRGNSPFGQRVPDSAVAAPAATPLELRGVFVDQGETFFSVYEGAARVSRWVGLNDEGNAFVVRSYDGSKGEAKIEYQGRELSISLKQAKVVALPLPPGPAAGPLPSPGAQPTVVASGAPSDEAVRLAQVAEEIRRRRALRQQAKQQSNPSPPAPPR